MTPYIKTSKVKPKISVLLPAYNHQDYIAATVESLLCQDEKQIEILAVDDGSTDDTGRILDKFAQDDPRLRVFHKENGGVVSALNYALERAEGEWIATCGSDDTVPKHAYSRFLAASKNVDIVIGEFMEFDDNGSKTRVRLNHKVGNSCFEALFAMPATWNKLIKTELIRRNGIQFPDVRICEDLIFLAHLAAAKPKYKFIRSVVYNYRNNTSSDVSMSHRYSVQTFSDHINGRLAVEQICIDSGINIARNYVFRDSLPYLSNYLQHLSGQDQIAAAEIFRKFVAHGMSSVNENMFELLFAVPLADFLKMSNHEYSNIIRHITPEEWVLRKYRAGEIGLSFLARCLTNWISFRNNKWRNSTWR